MAKLVGPALLVLLSITAPPTARATEVGNSRPLGLGFALGDPTSLVAKLFTQPGNAIDFGVSLARVWGRGACWDGDAWVNCGWGRALGFHADYLWQMNIIHNELDLDWHVGVGGRLWYWDRDVLAPGASRLDHFGLGVRCPIGLDLSFAQPDFLEFFLELAPVFFVLPATDLGFEVALGVRFFF